MFLSPQLILAHQILLYFKPFYQPMFQRQCKHKRTVFHKISYFLCVKVLCAVKKPIINAVSTPNFLCRFIMCTDLCVCGDARAAFVLHSKRGRDAINFGLIEGMLRCVLCALFSLFRSPRSAAFLGNYLLRVCLKLIGHLDTSPP